jgi:lysyl-tRNA synthetase class I
LAVAARPLRIELTTPTAAAAEVTTTAPGGSARRAEPGADRVRRLLAQDRGVDHWAHDYAARLAERCPPGGSVLIQTSMSPSGPFHVGNFRDTVTAHLVARAVRQRDRRARILLSFDDFDAFSPARSAGDPAVARYRSRPMADAAARSRAICRDYVAELKAVGICPPEADEDGRLHGGDGAGDWAAHYQAERYRSGRYLVRQRRLVADRRRLADLLGVAEPERLFTPYCAQCGRNTTATSTMSARRLAYACRSCRARVDTVDLRELKPAWAVDWMLRVWHEGIDCEPAGHDHCVAGSTMDRTRPVFAAVGDRPQPVIVPYGLVRQFGDAGKVSGSRGGGLRVADLLEVMPPRVVLWLYARPNVRADMRIGLDLGSLARIYAEHDAFVAAAAAGERRARALWRLLSDDDPPAAALPGFRRTAGAVQSQLGDLPAAEAALRAGRYAGAAVDGLRERLVHARSWLATWGRDHCWLPRTCAGPAGVAVDLDVLADRILAGAPVRSGAPSAAGVTGVEWERARVGEVLVGVRAGVVADVAGGGPRVEVGSGPAGGGPDDAGPALSAADLHDVAFALWGTTTAPPLSRVVDRCGAEAVADALRAYRRDGSRPLRRLVERRLVAREEPRWA